MIKNPPKKTKQTAKKKTPMKKDIPKEVLSEFVGHVPNLWMISAINLWDNRYRINAWTEEWKDDCITPSYKIEKSFFVHYHDAEQMILDKTLAPKPKSEKIF
tara:strand:+ start:4071 stop:4376 length:306 start_codon:yes stop_codon:yes gene_type:complete